MTWRFVGANFDQMHMNTNLEWVAAHPDAELVAVCDENPSSSTGSMEQAASDLELDDDRVYDDFDRCLREAAPDVVIGGPKNADHADFVERVAPHDVHVAVEKPMAGSLADCDRMIDAMEGTGNRLAINWPVTWSATKHEVKRLVESGTIGDVIEVQFYGGNSGAPPEDSWFYDADAGGGSLLDYLGYGATFSTWFRDGELPDGVAAQTHVPDDLDVDVQSNTTCRYGDGLSVLQTSWRMFTHPWEGRNRPPKGYELAGTEGTISTREPDAPIVVQTDDDPEGRAVEPEPLQPPHRNLVQYLIHCLETGAPLEGPTNAEFSREAHRIVETARRSARDDGGELPLAD